MSNLSEAERLSEKNEPVDDDLPHDASPRCGTMRTLLFEWTLLVVALGLSLGSLYLIINSVQTDAPASAPRNSSAQILAEQWANAAEARSEHHAHYKQQLLDALQIDAPPKDSPQDQALDWLVQEDRQKHNLSSVSQRYAIVVFHLATGRWNLEGGFATPSGARQHGTETSSWLVAFANTHTSQSVSGPESTARRSTWSWMAWRSILAWESSRALFRLRLGYSPTSNVSHSRVTF